MSTGGARSRDWAGRRNKAGSKTAPPKNSLAGW